MDRQLLLNLAQATIPLALGVALVAAALILIRRHRNTAAIRRRMAEINAGINTGAPELTAIPGGKAGRQGAWLWRKAGGAEGKQTRAA